MYKMITLSEAAEELHLFYRDLLLLLEHAHIMDTDGILPNDTIAYGELEYLKKEFAEHLPPDRITQSKGGFDALRYGYEQEIERKYADWFREWVQQNKAKYIETLHVFRHRIAKIGLAEPSSYADFCNYVWAHCRDNRSTMNDIFSRSIEWGLFEIYDKCKVENIPLKRFMGYKGWEEVPNVPFIETVEPTSDNTNQSNIKKRKHTKQWAFYFGFLKIRKQFDLEPSEAGTKYFTDFGKEHNLDGRHIYQMYTKMTDEKGIIAQMKRGSGKVFVEMAIEMLTINGYADVAEYARNQYDNVFKK